MGYVCLRKGEGCVCVCCCPEDVLLLIQRPNIEQNTRAFCMHCCVCAQFLGDGSVDLLVEHFESSVKYFENYWMDC